MPVGAKPLFVALSSRRIAELINQATHYVCYVAPGIQDEPAGAILQLAKIAPAVRIMVNVDFDERTLRMGYGNLDAVSKLRSAGIPTGHFAGFRSAVLIVDDRGWVFTPMALYLEAEPHSDETPNALCLSEVQVRELLLRLSPAAREVAIAEAAEHKDGTEPAKIPPLEFSTEPVEAAHFEAVKKAIEIAPPVQFDVARQVRVFEPYLQYVELSLTGAAIQRRRVQIPKSIQKLGTSTDLEGRLRTTLDLIEKASQFSSKQLEAELNEIRKNFTPSLGKDHGRVVLKNAKPVLTARLEELRTKLKEHQARIEKELQVQLDRTKGEVVAHYLPLAQANPPDALRGQSLWGEYSCDDVRTWLVDKLGDAIPEAKELVDKMTLDVRYKDVTFETLNHSDFLESLKRAFPLVNWEKAYNEFRAAGESDTKGDDEPPAEGIVA